jgi:2-phosphoglycerate kinase
VIVPLLVTIEDEDLHRSHFYLRAREPRGRSGDRYLAAFKKIRRIQKYMINSAMMRKVPIVEHDDLDNTLSKIIDQVITKALEAAERGAVVTPGGDDKLLEKAVQVVGKQKNGKTEGKALSETVP